MLGPEKRRGRARFRLPHWSPDGESIAFHSNLEGQWELYVSPAAGGKPRKLTSCPLQYFNLATRQSTTVVANLGDTVDLPITASPDGRTILYSRMDTAVDDLVLVENFR